jgi:hypothetical protein
VRPHPSRRESLRVTGVAALISTLRLPAAAAMTSDAVGTGGDEDQSLSFDGGGGHLLVANDGAFDRQEDAVTVEWWQYLDIGDRDLSTWFPQVLDLGVTNASTSGQLGVHLDGRTADGLLVRIGDGDPFTFLLSVAGLYGGWAHLAIVRNGPDLRAYRDGTLLGSYDSLTGMPVASAGASLAVGTDQQAIASPGTRGRSSFSGLIADLRISRVERYLGAGFTPPTTGPASDADTLLLLGVDDPFRDTGPVARDVTTVSVEGSVPAPSSAVPYGW